MVERFRWQVCDSEFSAQKNSSSSTTASVLLLEQLKTLMLGIKLVSLRNLTLQNKASINMS
ncbi:hypothetical protein C4K25_5893 [Pseudomonas chlororaphis]|nr:hypothetical protein C4K25_5893 [Pseudomonas chlororaphis]